MRRLTTISIICGCLFFSMKTNARDFANKGDLVLGARAGFGFAWGARNDDLKDAMDTGFMFGNDLLNVSDIKNSAGFSGGGWIYTDYYLLHELALQGGIGFVGKGAHFKNSIQSVIGDRESDLWIKMAYMEIPLGIKINIHNFRISSLVLLNIALTGKIKTETNGHSDEDDFDDDSWDFWRRFNVGLRLLVEYAIPLGPIAIVPGVDWSTHFIDEIKDDDYDDYQIRWMNFFFNIALEFRLPV